MYSSANYLKRLVDFKTYNLPRDLDSDEDIFQMEQLQPTNPLIVQILQKIYAKALVVLEANDDIKVQCKASEVLLLQIMS